MSRTGGKHRASWRAAALLGAMVLAAGPTAAGADATGSIGSQEWWLYGKLDYSGAWPTSLGDNTTVAVLGDAVDPSVPDLSGSLQPALSFPPNIAVTDANVAGEDCFANEAASLIAGHGHPVAGGSDGVVGIAAHAKILPLAVGVQSNNIAESSYLSQAIHVAVGDGVKIIDILLPAADDPIVQGAVDYALAHGAIVVAPSGNNTSAGNIMWTPAALKGVLAVGGIQSTDLNWWPTSASGARVSVAAPATNVIADGPGGQYQLHNGTNCGAALVAGEAALVWSLHPKWTAGQVEQVILNTASGDGKRINDDLGFGVVNPTLAVAAPAPKADAAPLGAPPSAQGPTVTPVAVPASSSSSIYLIIGAIVIGLVLIAAVAFFLQRHRRNSFKQHGYMFEPAPLVNRGPNDPVGPPPPPEAVYGPGYGPPPGPPSPYQGWDQPTQQMPMAPQPQPQQPQPPQPQPQQPTGPVGPGRDQWPTQGPGDFPPNAGLYTHESLGLPQQPEFGGHGQPRTTPEDGSEQPPAQQQP